ncbi:acetaldehyde dehydrogenase (acetylating) [candidate division KSB1 bacterium]
MELTDKDLQSVQEARQCAEKAHEAFLKYEEFSQEAVDEIVRAVAVAAFMISDKVARMAVEETGFGKYEDKVIKNIFSSRDVYHYIKDMKTVGVIRRDEANKVYEISQPMGVVAALTPSTNPTSTAMYKILIALKARNAIVIAPHPSATNCVIETVNVMVDAAKKAGAPDNLIQCMSISTLPGTTELMKHKQTNVILATGGMGMVRAAYSSGKPAYGVGPGNVPAYIDRSADIPKAVSDIVAGKSFDYGTVCASEQSVVCDAPVRDQVIEELKAQKCYLCSDEERAKLEAVMIQPNGAVNPGIVGRHPQHIARLAGIQVPDDTKVLVVFLEGVGKDYPLSCEKLSPVLAFYAVEGWEEGCRKCMDVLEFGGMGHTLTIHCKDENIISEFGLKKPAFRICVNTSGTHGAIGYSTSIAPAMTLGPGTFAGSITSENISPEHLMHIKRLAYETKPLGPVSLDVSLAAFDRTSVSRSGGIPEKTGRYSRFDDEPIRVGKSGTAAEAGKAEKTYGAPSVSDGDIDRILQEFKRNRP